MAELKILTVNCQGIGLLPKRTDVLHYLKEKRCQIYCLQDTHFSPGVDEKYVRSHWNGDCYFSSFKSNARGVAILFTKTFEYKVHKCINDTNGNFLLLDMTANNNRFTLVTIYGPNTDNPQFFENISNKIAELENDSVIWCGDFNLVLDPKLDYCNYKTINNKNAREILLNIINTKHLIDPFRDEHADLRRYTWRRKQPFQQARLDFFLISEDLLTSVKKCIIENSYRSDHCPVLLSLCFKKFVKGKSLWKFNNSLLKDTEYLETINKKIEEVKLQYSLPIYNNENLQNIPNSEIQFTINDQLFLDTLLMEIRGQTISFSSYKKKQNDQNEKLLAEKILKLEQNLTEDKMEELENLKLELTELRQIKVKGAVIRSRATNLLEGEKPTKYFCSLETHNYLSKIILKLETADGKIITDQNDILKESELFYKNLYSNKDDTSAEINVKEYLKDLNVPKLTDNESNQLEGTLTLQELTNALSNMKNNKSPGTDGYSCEFFKVFWNRLGSFVLRSINHSYEIGELSLVQKQGIITLLPKENKSRQKLANYRPICLLNTIYKIASASIANRIKTVLDKLIHKNQSGFISGRYIGDNTRLLYDLMQFVDENNIPGLLLLIDFEKAFDSLSWSFLREVLSYFNFGPSIIQWIFTFYDNTQVTINQGGNLSSFFKTERGCKQGDPISPYLFILCAEILAIKIRNNKKIKGIKINDKDFVLTQYADDTTVILDGSEDSLKETLYELDEFAKKSGLKVNFSKTHVVWIGSKKYSTQSIKTRWKLQWGVTRFKMLGIIFDTDLTKMLTLNFSERISNMKAKIKYWKGRNLTPLGKITIIKSLLLPSFNHLLLSLPNPEDKTLKEMNEILYNFIWEGTNRIKKTVICQEYSDGGLKMINIEDFITALKTTWVRKLIINNSLWSTILQPSVNVQSLLTLGTTYITENILRKTKNRFWKDVFQSHIKISEKQTPTDIDQFQATPLFLNKNIKIGNKPVYNKSCIKNGICFINDITKADGNLLTYDELKQAYNNININFLQYSGLVKSVQDWKKTLNLNNTKYKVETPILPFAFKIYLKSIKGIQDMYKLLNNNKEIPSGRIAWNKKYSVDNNEWKIIFNEPFKITKDTTMQWFQTRINHKILATNKFLCKIKVTNDPKCSFCAISEETIEHLLWECNYVKDFLHEAINWLSEHNIHIHLEEKSFLFGLFKNQDNEVNKLVLMEIKYYIYFAKCSKNNLRLSVLKQRLKLVYQTQQYASILENKYEIFQVKWQNFHTLFI